MTGRVKNTELTHSLTRQMAKFFMIYQPVVKMLQSDFSTMKLICPIISVTKKEFETLVLKVDQSLVDVISSACRHWVITVGGDCNMS